MSIDSSTGVGPGGPYPENDNADAATAVTPNLEKVGKLVKHGWLAGFCFGLSTIDWGGFKD
jgi:hypothetical protein